MVRPVVLVALILILAADDPKLTVSPRVLMAGNTVRMTCRVPRHPDNRLVQWGFSDYLNSTRDLEGERSPITWEAYFNHVPCDPGIAYCAVVRANGKVLQTTERVEVAGCR